LTQRTRKGRLSASEAVFDMLRVLAMPGLPVGADNPQTALLEMYNVSFKKNCPFLVSFQMGKFHIEI
jgi:hypothetical protein